MRSVEVVVDSPVLDEPAGLGEAHEPVLIEAFVAAGAIEAFHVGVLNRLARFDELEFDPVLG